MTTQQSCRFQSQPVKRGAPVGPQRAGANREGSREMYRFSRAIYRELANEIVEERVCPDGASNHERVLKACEAAVLRLATDRHYFARPSKTLFNDIRVFFPMCAQHKAYRVVDLYLGLCKQWLCTQP